MALALAVHGVLLLLTALCNSLLTAGVRIKATVAFRDGLWGRGHTLQLLENLVPSELSGPGWPELGVVGAQRILTLRRLSSHRWNLAH